MEGLPPSHLMTAAGPMTRANASKCRCRSSALHASYIASSTSAGAGSNRALLRDGLRSKTALAAFTLLQGRHTPAPPTGSKQYRSLQLEHKPLSTYRLGMVRGLGGLGAVGGRGLAGEGGEKWGHWISSKRARNPREKAEPISQKLGPGIPRSGLETPGNTLGTTPDMSLPCPCRVLTRPTRRLCREAVFCAI